MIYVAMDFSNCKGDKSCLLVFEKIDGKLFILEEQSENTRHLYYNDLVYLKDFYEEYFAARFGKVFTVYHIENDKLPLGVSDKNFNLEFLKGVVTTATVSKRFQDELLKGHWKDGDK